MTGEQLKNIIYHAEISQVEMAKRLGIAQQTLNSAFNSKDVKSSLIEKVAQVLGCSVADFYGGSLHDVTITNNATSVKGDNNQVASGEGARINTTDSDIVMGLLEELRAQRKQNEQLVELLKNKDK